MHYSVHHEFTSMFSALEFGNCLMAVARRPVPIATVLGSLVPGDLDFY